MTIKKVNASADELLDPSAPVWNKTAVRSMDLSPAPLAMVEERSPFLARSEGHGVIDRVALSALHNSKVIAIKLSWRDATRDDQLNDLNVFVDAVAILFPLSKNTNALTMGSETDPANAWYWKANDKEPYDVLSLGFGQTVRRPGKQSLLQSASAHDGASWSVVLQRPLTAPGSDFVQFMPGKPTALAVAVWDGHNKERSGRKAVLGDFQPMEIEA